MPNQRRAFTLIELLVVISIIALLISLLLPALGSARQSALITQCMTNFKQMDVGVHAYAADARGYWPDGGVQGGSYWHDFARIMSVGSVGDEARPWNLGLLYYHGYVTSLGPFIDPSRNPSAIFWTNPARAAETVGNPIRPDYRNSVQGFQIRVDNKQGESWSTVCFRGARWWKDNALPPAYGTALTYGDRYLYHEEIRPNGASGTIAYLSDDFSWQGSWTTGGHDPQGQYYHDERGYAVGYTDGHVEFVNDSGRVLIKYGHDSFGKTQHAYNMTFVAEDIWNAFDRNAGRTAYVAHKLY